MINQQLFTVYLYVFRTMNITMLAMIILGFFISNYQVTCEDGTTGVSTDGTVLYECDLTNVTNCKMGVDVRIASVLHWSVTQYNPSPPIRDNKDPVNGIFLVFHSWTLDTGIYRSVASTPELLLPSGKGTLSFSYYVWDLNDPLQLDYPKLKVFSCGNETRAIWKRTGDKVDRWLTTNIYLNCQDPFKIFFEGTVNGSNCGLALDDIVVRNGHILTPGPTKLPSVTTMNIQFNAITELSQPNASVTSAPNVPAPNQGNDELIIILIGIIIGLVFFIVVIIIIHCWWVRRSRHRKPELEPMDALVKRKRFQESKSGIMTTSGYMTLTKPKPFGNNVSAELGAIDLTNTPFQSQGMTSRIQQEKTPISRGKTLPRLPSLPEEAKRQQQRPQSLNMDVTYECVDEIPNVSFSKNPQADKNLPTGQISTISVEGRQDHKESSPVYFTLSPTDPAYSHLSEYGTMPDVVIDADDNGLVHKPHMAAKNPQRRKSSLSSLRDKLSKGLSNASNDYDELKHDEQYYEVVNVEGQL